MKCVACGEKDSVVGVIELRITPRLAKGGGLNLAGHTVKQSTLEEKWVEQGKKDGNGAETHRVECSACGVEMVYTKGIGLTRAPVASQSDAIPEAAAEPAKKPGLRLMKGGKAPTPPQSVQLQVKAAISEVMGAIDKGKVHAKAPSPAAKPLVKKLLKVAKK